VTGSLGCFSLNKAIIQAELESGPCISALMRLCQSNGGSVHKTLKIF